MVPDYVSERRQICKMCGIFDITADICNASLYVNPETNDVSILPKEGYFKGCGCHLSWKIANIKSKCPAGKW